MRRTPLLIATGVLVAAVAGVVALRVVDTYQSSASAKPPALTRTDDQPDPGVDPDAGSTPAVDPVQRQRYDAAAELVKKQPGKFAIVVRDRVAGSEWRAGASNQPIWTSSTIKLALAMSLLERHRSGEIKLDAPARKQIADMLEVSSDNAATALWNRYGKEAFVAWFQQLYGMNNLNFGSEKTPRTWGFLKCTTDDLLRLMSYVFERADPADRDYLVGAMRRVGPIQRWGTWAAGPDNQPGTKNGWSIETDDGKKHWATSTVGFAGPDARYLVAVMYDLPPGASVGTGVHAVSDVVATVFGAPTPAQVTVPPASTGR